MYGRLGMTGGSVTRGDSAVMKADTTMTDDESKRLVGIHGAMGKLPSTLSRSDRMLAHEARFVAAGGRKGEKWNRRAKGAEIARNVGVAGATVSAAALLARRGKRVGPAIAKIPKINKITPGHLEAGGLGAASAGGASELYGEYARHKRASYANSPAGVAASALTRMRGYTP